MLDLGGINRGTTGEQKSKNAQVIVKKKPDSSYDAYQKKCVKSETHKMCVLAGRNTVMSRDVILGGSLCVLGDLFLFTCSFKSPPSTSELSPSEKAVERFNLLSN